MRLRKYGNFCPGQATIEARSDLLEATRISFITCPRRSVLTALRERVSLIRTMMRTSPSTISQTPCL